MELKFKKAPRFVHLLQKKCYRNVSTNLGTNDSHFANIYMWKTKREIKGEMTRHHMKSLHFFTKSADFLEEWFIIHVIWKKTLIILKAWWSVIAVLVILISKRFHIQRSLALLSARHCASNVNHWLTMESLLKTRRLVTMSCHLSFRISLQFP